MGSQHDDQSDMLAERLFSSGLVLAVLSIVGFQTELNPVAIGSVLILSFALLAVAVILWHRRRGRLKPVTSVPARDLDSAASGDEERFAIALTFPGKRRATVEELAEQLAVALGRNRIFYDKFHSAMLARPNLSTYLQNLYFTRADLVVVFLCSDYASSEWCGLEFRAVQTLIKQHRDHQVMLVRLDAGEVEGIFEIDGYLDAESLRPEEIAIEIRKRYCQLTRSDIAESAFEIENAVDATASNRIREDLSRNRKLVSNSVCLTALGELLESEPDAFSLLTAKRSYSFGVMRVSFADADRKLFESDQSLGGRRHSLFCMAVYIVGAGLASQFEQSNASERLLEKLVLRLAEIANLQPLDLSPIEILFTACERRDQTEVARLLGAEFDD